MLLVLRSTTKPHLYVNVALVRDTFHEDYMLTRMLSRQVEPEDEANNTPYTDEDFAKLPASFDAREKWPKCVHPIRNQVRAWHPMRCSCWFLFFSLFFLLLIYTPIYCIEQWAHTPVETVYWYRM